MAECLNTSIGNLTRPSEDKSPEAELERQMHFIFMEIGVPTVCVFGLVGNILNLMVLTREKIQCSLTKMEKSAHIGLIALAVSDLMFCLLALLFALLPKRPPYYTSQSGVMYYHWLGGNVITLFIVTSTWLIVVMAGERYLAVCHPFKARNFISLRKTKITVLAVFATCLLSTVPLYFEKEILQTDCYNFSPIYKIIVNDHYGKGGVSVRRLVWAIVFDFIPSLALLYFNTCLVWKIHTAKKIRKEMTPGQHYKRGKLVLRSPSPDDNSPTNCRTLDTGEYQSLPLRSNIRNHDYSYRTRVETNPADTASGRKVSYKSSLLQFRSKKRQSDNALNSVTATLVAVALLFLILVSPSEVLKFIFQQLHTGDKYKEIIFHVTNFMQSLNFSVNFVLYCAVNKTFRKTLGSICCFCLRSNMPTHMKGHVQYTHQQELS